MAREERLEILEPGDMLLARAVDILGPMEHEADTDVIPDDRTERGTSSATTEDYAYSVTLHPARPGTRRVGSLPPSPGRRARGRSRGGRVARFAALLVAVMSTGAALGVLVYERLALNIESARLSTTPQQQPAPVLPAPPHETPTDAANLGARFIRLESAAGRWATDVKPQVALSRRTAGG